MKFWFPQVKHLLIYFYKSFQTMKSLYEAQKNEINETF